MQDEFLITNQLGGYSSSTFTNGNTRKYHGLFIVGDEDLNRKVIISTLEENIYSKEKVNHLNVFHFLPNVKVKDESIDLTFTKIEKSRVIFEYLFPWGKLTKEILLMQEEHSLEVKYKFITNQELKFEISPFILNRSIHEVGTSNLDKGIKITNYLNKYNIPLSNSENLEMFIMSFNAGNLINLDNIVKEENISYKNFLYEIEKERGFKYQEDILKAFTMKFELVEGESYINIKFRYFNNGISPQRKSIDALKVNPNLYFFNKIKSSGRNTLVDLKNYLLNKSEDFLIDYNKTKTINAGYHWFNDWGRDTFLSFRGLLLTTDKQKFAKEVLIYWSKLIDENGFLPNDLRSNNYNSIDASLWYIVAIYYYYHHTKDIELIKILFPKIDFILSKYIQGNDKYSMKLSREKFLLWEDSDYSLTWMDSIVDNSSATKRIGAAIEIQMLWYNAYKIYEFFEKLLKTKNSKLELKELFKNFKKDFEKKFINKNNGYVYDFINNEDHNNQIRPNVIIGLSLPFPLLTPAVIKNILKITEERLLSDYGLYTLDPNDIDFISNITGDIKNRDKAYHNGAIWPYLLGLYLKSYLSTYKYTRESKDYVFNKLNIFWKGITEKGLNYLPELFSPCDMKAEGALSQAWNYATLLEVLYDFEKVK